MPFQHARKLILALKPLVSASIAQANWRSMLKCTGGSSGRNAWNRNHVYSFAVSGAVVSLTRLAPHVF